MHLQAGARFSKHTDAYLPERLGVAAEAVGAGGTTSEAMCASFHQTGLCLITELMPFGELYDALDSHPPSHCSCLLASAPPFPCSSTAG